MDIAAADCLLAERRGAIAWITLNRPHTRNALSVAMMTAIEAALAQARDARAVVIAGTGPGFCGGHDLKEMRANPAPEFQAALFAQCSRMMQAIVNHPAPVIASVHGIATAGGCQLVAACDLAIAAEDAKFATSGVNLGLFCSTPGVALARVVPRKAALAMLLTGDFIPASQALAIGLVNRVVPAAGLEAATMALAEAIAGKERRAIEIGKRCFYRQVEAPLERAYAIASEAMVENMMATETTAAIDAFINRPKSREKGMDTPRRLYDRTTQDVGNLVEFGHVNTRVPDQRLATLFYVSGLGLTRDPYLMTSTDNMWVNAGRCQFHLPTGAAQVLRGVVGLVLPDLDALERRLARVRPQLAGTQFDFSRAGDAILATSPWGNRLRIHAPDPARFGDTALGMPYVELACPPGSAAGIVRFYREIMGTPAHLEEAMARVPVGLAGELRYVETDSQQPPYDGNHVQVSLADFSGPYRRLLERGLISEESDESQYRFLDIVDPAEGRVLLRIEHEVRSMRHPMFARPLVNRNPDVNNRNYVPGAEAAAWALQPSS